MSKKNCPFWSTTDDKFECYRECPMNTFFSIKDNCPFKEYLGSNANISFKGIDELDYDEDREKDVKVDFLYQYK